MQTRCPGPFLHSRDSPVGPGCCLVGEWWKEYSREQQRQHPGAGGAWPALGAGVGGGAEQEGS